MTNFDVVAAWLEPLLLIKSSGDCKVVKKHYEQQGLNFQTLQSASDVFYLGILAIWTKSYAEIHKLQSEHNQAFSFVYSRMKNESDFWSLAKSEKAGDKKQACVLWSQECFGNGPVVPRWHVDDLPFKWNSDVSLKNVLNVVNFSRRILKLMYDEPRTDAARKWSKETYLEYYKNNNGPAMSHRCWYEKSTKPAVHMEALKELKFRMDINRDAFYRSHHFSSSQTNY